MKKPEHHAQPWSIRLIGMSQVNPPQLPAQTSGVSRAIQPWRDRTDAFAGDGGTNDGKRVRSALWRYKWLIIALPPLAAVGGYGASRFVKPVYTARATVWINKQADVASTRGPQDQQFGSQAWVDLFRSYTVIDRVVSERHLSLNLPTPVDSALLSSFAGLEAHFTPGRFELTVDPDGKNYELATATGTIVERRPVGGPVGSSLGFKWTPPASSLPAGKAIAFVILSPRQAAIGLLDRLRVTVDGTGTFLHAELTGNDPAVVAAALNSMIQHFVAVAARLKSEGLNDRTRILDDQLKSAQRGLASAETELEQFRLKSILRPNATAGAPKKPTTGEAPGDPAATAYFSMRGSMDAALRERTAIRRVLSEASDSGLVVGDLERLPSVMASSELTAALKELTARRDSLRILSLKYTDSHPLVVRARSQISALERGAIPEMANRIASSLKARETELADSVRSTERDLRETPALASTEARLQRNVTLAEGLYSQLQPRYAEAQVAEGSAVPDVQLLDPAEAPQFADRILTTRLILVAFLGGLGLACAGAITLDKIDPKFRYPDQISQELGLTILGALPHVTSKGKSGADTEEKARFQEAIREIRMNVEYSYGSAGPLIFTVSSPGPADGKSFLSPNLARSFAESGRRTLLVDADLRRGSLHRRCGVSRRPGLTDCLRGDAPVEQVVQHTKFPQLDIVASGTRNHDAPELLGSPATAQLFGEFRSRYDVIICDSPPLSAGIDPFVLAALSGSLLLVVRTGVSLREVIESKLQVLGRMPVRILGVVLNGVPRDAIYGYYSSYMPGYDTSDETGVALPTIIV
jgi:succinoglycan biosynthesis transport protein ExoP